MKTIKFLAVLAIGLVFSSSYGQAQSSSKIEIIDFHSTHRCMTCNAIEANTKYTLETYFAKEVKAGTITFQTINVNEKQNEKIAEKFEASGTALIMNVIKNGKETPLDITSFAFMKGNDKPAFSKELRSKIQTQLNTL